jgi:hypothetical protein
LGREIGGYVVRIEVLRRIGRPVKERKHEERNTVHK